MTDEQALRDLLRTLARGERAAAEAGLSLTVGLIGAAMLSVQDALAEGGSDNVILGPWTGAEPAGGHAAAADA